MKVRSRTHCAWSLAVLPTLCTVLRLVLIHIIEWLGLLVAQSRRHIYRSQRSPLPSILLHYTKMGWTNFLGKNTPDLFIDSKHCASKECRLHKSSSWDPAPRFESTTALFGVDLPCTPYVRPFYLHYPIYWHLALLIEAFNKFVLNKMRLPALKVFILYLLLLAHQLGIQVTGVRWLAVVCLGWTQQ